MGDLNPFEKAGPMDPAGVMSGTGLAGGEYGESAMVAGDPLDLFGHQSDMDQAAADLKAEEAKSLEQQWLNYVKKQYEPYSETAQAAMGAQRGLVGLGEEGEQARMVAEITADPLYQAKVKAGDDAVLRGASMTGGLRSGDASSALALQNQNLLSQEIDSRYDKFAGLSGLGFRGTQALTDAGGRSTDRYAGILGNQAQGIITAGAANQEAMSGLAGGVMAMFSDERLKTDITKKGEKHGMPWYEWTWNETANKKLELFGKTEGHMASDVELKYPDLVSYSDGYKTVDYGGLA